MSIENTIIYLIGPPGVGKLTVAREISTKIDARIVDNHLWLNPVLALVEQDGVAPLAPEVWHLVRRVRCAVFDTAKNLTPASWSLILTHAAVEESESDWEIAREVKDVARCRDARLVTVLLSCSADALAARVKSPERRVLFKEIDESAARSNAVRPVFNPHFSETLSLDTTHLSAADAAREIVRFVET